MSDKQVKPGNSGVLKERKTPHKQPILCAGKKKKGRLRRQTVDGGQTFKVGKRVSKKRGGKDKGNAEKGK